IQADRLGDLDHGSKQVLDRTDAKSTGVTISARLVSFDQKRTELTPGTVLVREWDRRSQRVMVMPDGFAWNGQTYDSLSKVAFAITGTKWNGPRFFGLRDKEDRLDAGARLCSAHNERPGRAARASQQWGGRSIRRRA